MGRPIQRILLISQTMLLLVNGFTTTIRRRPSSFLQPHLKSNNHLRLFSSKEEWTTDKVRSQFIDYFVSKQNHTFYPSSPCAPLSDPTLLFTNAGMNQFKPIFLNQIPPNTPLVNLKRATNSQKCIRAGGKHNDLEDVGKDTYHHTFFEMLGTWSFGDYFKEEAVDMAWDLLVNVYGLEEDRLYATYFGGDGSVEVDEEVRGYWRKYLPDERILACDAKDNFWEMGETGPCGPCTEIHYDRIGNRDAAHLVNADDPDVMEIWNLVFIQYNRDTKGLSPLPAKHIDTGLGLERLASILQKKSSNYDIDAFTPILEGIEGLTGEGVGPYKGRLGAEDTELIDTAYRAVSDHIRTLCFAIADGAVPNNEGRGYVLRRILRRAARYGKQILKCEPGFMEKLVPVIMDTYGETYPELIQNQKLITDIIREEESSFSSMLQRGIKYLSTLETELASAKDKVVKGDQVFFLYDTLGFPTDLTQLMASEAGLTVDIQGFEEYMEQQKERSREARKKAKSAASSSEDIELGIDDVAQLEKEGIPASIDDDKYYWDVDVPAKIQAIFTSEGRQDTISPSDEPTTVGLVLDRTSFYAEAGGQENDIGTISILSSDNEEIASIQVTNVQSYGEYVFHVGTFSGAEITPDSKVVCKVDYARRKKIAPNHTMTHVLNAALQTYLGDGVEQRGSLVNDEKLRFDFSHGKALTTKELTKIEQFVNDVIAEELPVEDETVPLEEAKKIPGVCAVFGEVYPDPVRVVKVGDDTSVEFCGGTHLTNTKEAQGFVIVEETAVAKGIRRITGVTQDLAQEALRQGEKIESIIAKTENSKSSDLETQAVSLRKELESLTISASLKPTLRTRIEKLQKKALDKKKAALAKTVDTYIQTYVKERVEAHDAALPFILYLDGMETTDSKVTQKIMNNVKSMLPSTPFLGIAYENSKVMAFANVPQEKQDCIQANDWVKSTLAEFGGKGGGKPGNAQGQAQGVEKERVEDVVKVATDYAVEKMGAGIS